MQYFTTIIKIYRLQNVLGLLVFCFGSIISSIKQSDFVCREAQRKLMSKSYDDLETTIDR